MSVLAYYEFLKLTERIGADALVVRRCRKRLERNEMSITEALELLKPLAAEIVTPTYRGPERRKRPWRIDPGSLLDRQNRSGDFRYSR